MASINGYFRHTAINVEHGQDTEQVKEDKSLRKDVGFEYMS